VHWSKLYARADPPRLVKVVEFSAVAPGLRLPLRVAPVPGEAIDSWLELTARRMDLPLGAVAGALDLPIVTRPTWTRWLSLDQLEAMTLSVYDGTALQLDPDSPSRSDVPVRSIAVVALLSGVLGRVGWALAVELATRLVVCVLANADHRASATSDRSDERGMSAAPE
jgi:hypothetical protein